MPVIDCAGKYRQRASVHIPSHEGRTKETTSSLPRMAEVHPFPRQRREFITDGERSELRATWHNDSGYVVISLWRAEVCVATSHLTPGEAARLSGFITNGLADLANDGLYRKVTSIRPKGSSPLRRGADAWKRSLASSLEWMARRLR